MVMLGRSTRDAAPTFSFLTSGKQRQHSYGKNDVYDSGLRGFSHTSVVIFQGVDGVQKVQRLLSRSRVERPETKEGGRRTRGVSLEPEKR
jgi:hypothetical protein